MKNSEKNLDTIKNLCQNRGFVYPGSDIYGGLANTWDYGPLGTALKNNIKSAWLKKFVQENKYNVGLDAAILMNPQTWVASGHLGGFSDQLMDCKECKTRHRADNLIEEFDGTNVAGWTNEQLADYINEKNIPCPNCGKHNFTDIRQFNLMFKTFQGVTEDSKDTLYLRPETAQGIFVNFSNIQRTTRKKVPFGVAQIGKSFRNEITPGKFIFRVREFEQMELEFFCKPGTDLEWFDYWQQQTLNIVSRLIGANSGVLPTERIMTLHSTATQAARALNILTRQQMKNIFRMLSSLLLVWSVFSLQSLPRLMTRSRSTKRIQESFFVSILHLHRSKLLFFRFPKSLTSRLKRYSSSWQKTLWWNMMMQVLSENVIAVRTKSVHRSALLMTSTALKTTV